MGACCVVPRKSENFGDSTQTLDESPKADSASLVGRLLVNRSEDSFIHLAEASAIDRIYKRGKTTIHFHFSTVHNVIHIPSSNSTALDSLIKTVMLDTPALLRVFRKHGLQKKIHLSRFFEAIAIQKELDHPNIAKIFELFQDANHYYIVYEYLKGETLLDYMSQNKVTGKGNVMQLARQIISILGYLHRKNIVNGYVCPENFIFAIPERFDTLKIFDFTFVERVSDGEEVTHTPISLCYSPPECLKFETYDKKSEIWSLGAMLYYYLIGDKRHIYENVKQALLSTERFSFSDLEIPQKLKEVLTECLASDPDSRPTIQEIGQNPLFQLKHIDTSLINTVLDRIRGVKIKNRLHQLLLTLIIDRILNARDKIPYRHAFTTFDGNYNGTVVKTELLAKYSKMRGDLIAAKNEISHIFYQIDVDKTQELTFTEFLTIALDRTLLLSSSNILTAFKFLDRDGKGYLTHADFSLYFGAGKVSEDDLKKIATKKDKEDDLKVCFSTQSIQIVN